MIASRIDQNESHRQVFLRLRQGLIEKALTINALLVVVAWEHRELPVVGGWGKVNQPHQ
jgi:hypothetical protein